jgi:hypothetical protein
LAVVSVIRAKCAESEIERRDPSAGSGLANKNYSAAGSFSITTFR